MVDLGADGKACSPSRVESFEPLGPNAKQTPNPGHAEFQQQAIRLHTPPSALLKVWNLGVLELGKERTMFWIRIHMLGGGEHMLTTF